MFGLHIAILLAFTVTIPLIVGLFYFRYLTPPYKYVVALLGMRFLSELLLLILLKAGFNNLVYLHFYAPIEIVLLSLFFIHLFKTWSSEYKRVIWIVTLVVTGISLLYSVVGNNIAEFNSFPRALESIYFSGLSSFVFYEFVTDPEPVNVGFYFVNGAVLFYFSSCFIVFAFSKYIPGNDNNLLIMSNVHSIVIAICNLAYAIGLWKASSKSYSAA